MKIDISAFKNDEKAIFSLRSLYERYGYTQYKMNKFEEYDLYVRNKDFLVSDNIITFTDTDGKLMALKPDVTLSIIKNASGDGEELKKVYYNENVYRVSKGTHSYKEIMQVGLECVGKVDRYCIFEVLLLAIKSLESISEDFVLDVSHMGVITELISGLDIDGADKKRLLKYIGEKNTHDIKSIEGCEGLSRLISTYGTADSVKPILCELYGGELSFAASELTEAVLALEKMGYKDKIRIDFSVINDMNYYSGIVFKGFVNGIPSSILSGGQYDHLMRKMGRNENAIGFAVYLDMLELYAEIDREYDVDTLVLYGENTEPKTVSEEVERVTAAGKSALASRAVAQSLKYRTLIDLTKEGN